MNSTPYASPLQNRGDDLLIEDQHFAVVYNGSVGGTYDVMLKYTEQKFETISEDMELTGPARM